MRGYLLLLVFSVLIPVALFAGIVLSRYYTSELSRIEQDLQNEARKLALTLDRDLAGHQTALQTFSVSRRIVDRDYAGFYQQALQVRGMIGVNILLRDLAGQQLVNTRVPWGTPLP